MNIYEQIMNNLFKNLEEGTCHVFGMTIIDIHRLVRILLETSLLVPLNIFLPLITFYHSTNIK